MSKTALAEVATRYCGQSNQLSLDDFVLVATKITATSGDSVVYTSLLVIY